MQKAAWMFVAVALANASAAAHAQPTVETEGDAEGELVAVSAFGNASTTAYCAGGHCINGLAISGTGDATTPTCYAGVAACTRGLAVSGSGNATGDDAISGTGNAKAFNCNEEYRCRGSAAASGTGDAHGLLISISALGKAGREDRHDHNRTHQPNESDFSFGGGGAEGRFLAVALLGNATNEHCDFLATGACPDAPTASVAGDAESCKIEPNCIALSAFGNSTGYVAISATGESRGTIAVGGCQYLRLVANGSPCGWPIPSRSLLP